MDKCERLAALLSEFEEAGNEEAAAGIRVAMAAAGCNVTAKSGGTGRPPPDDPGGGG